MNTSAFFDEGFGIGMLAIMAVVIVALILVHTWVTSRSRPHHATEGFSQKLPTQGNKDDDRLVNYYWLASDNTCCEGAYNDGKVSIDQMKRVLQEGARFVDFAIYTMPNGCDGSGMVDEPAVAGSASNSDLSIGTTNCLPVSRVMSELASTAFSAGQVPRPTEPLFIHLRLRTKHDSTLTFLGDSIRRNFGGRLLSANKYGGSGTNGPATVSILNTPLTELRGKCIVILESDNRNWTSNRALADVVNIAQGAGEPFFQSISAPIQRVSVSKHTPDANMERLSLITPTTESGDGPVSYPFGPNMLVGAQFIAMPFHINNQNTQAAKDFFNKHSSGHVLKPPPLLQKIVKVPAPKPQNPDLSYAKRTKSSAYYSFSV
jgi:hypothetical protein